MTDISNTASCAVEGCVNLSRYAATGYCAMHQVRNRKYGDPGQPGPLKPKDTHADIEAKLRFYGWQVTESGCWEWRGPRRENGYGIVRAEGKTQVASRLSYRAFVGPIPDGHLICHRCDNPPCMNPDHLFAGTQADNMDDMWSKGRGTNGERQGSAVLDAASVLEMRRLREAGTPVRALAETYGVHVRQAYKIINREQWAHVHDEDAKGSPS